MNVHPLGETSNSNQKCYHPLVSDKSVISFMFIFKLLNRSCREAVMSMKRYIVQVGGIFCIACMTDDWIFIIQLPKWWSGTRMSRVKYSQLMKERYGSVCTASPVGTVCTVPMSGTPFVFALAMRYYPKIEAAEKSHWSVQPFLSIPIDEILLVYLISNRSVQCVHVQED